MSSGGKIGDTITMESECDRIGSISFVMVVIIGKTLLFSSMTLRNEKNEVFAKGRHTKFVALAWKEEKNKVGELD
jgi:acyl-coenzyme A thioesterase 13